MMKGKPTKQRLNLILAFVKAIQLFQKDNNLDASNLDGVLSLMRSMIIELISAIRNTNQKIRVLAEESFTKMAQILSLMKSLPQLFQMLLIGLAG